MATEKTWQFCLNLADSDTSSVANLSKSQLMNLKNMLRGNGVTFTDAAGSAIGSPQGLWATYYSCDSVTAGTANDGVDRWAAIANIVRNAAGVHSWFVLKSQTMSTTTFTPGAPLYMILDCNGSTDQSMATVIFSKAAPTGGTTSARPTATDEWVHGACALNDNTASAGKCHMGLTSQGAFWFGTSKNTAGYMYGGICAFLLEDTRTTDLYPWLTYFGYLVNGTNDFRGAFSQACFCRYSPAGSSTGGAWRARAHDGAEVINETAPLNPMGGSATNNFIDIMDTFSASTYDRITGKSFEFPMWIFSYKAASNYFSYRGRIPDFFWGQDNLTYPTYEPTVGTYSTGNFAGIWMPVNAALSL